MFWVVMASSPGTPHTAPLVGLFSSQLFWMLQVLLALPSALLEYAPARCYGVRSHAPPLGAWKPLMGFQCHSLDLK